jgi:hypothetical protein
LEIHTAAAGYATSQRSLVTAVFNAVSASASEIVQKRQLCRDVTYVPVQATCRRPAPGKSGNGKEESVRHGIPVRVAFREVEATAGLAVER